MPRICAILLGLVLLAGCQGGHGTGMSRLYHYNLRARHPALVTARSGPAGAEEVARQALDGLTMDLRLQRYEGVGSVVRLGLEDGAVIGSSSLGSGTLAVSEELLELQFPAAPTAEGTLSVEGTLQHGGTEALIESVIRPFDSPNVSAGSIECGWTVSGELDGAPFVLQLTQALEAYVEIEHHPI